MVLLRMLTFRRAADTSEPAEPKRKDAQLRVGEDPAPGFGTARDGGRAASESKRSIASSAQGSPPSAAAPRPVVAAVQARADALEPPGPPDHGASAALTPAAWAALAERLSLRGPARELALNASLVALAGTSLKLALKPQHENLRSASTEAQLCSALTPHLGVVNLEFRVGEAVAESAAERIKREREAKQAGAEAALQNDPIVSGLIEVFGARIVPGSVRAAE
jgi:DNA polymerase-3 subunit gamma/tau